MGSVRNLPSVKAHVWRYPNSLIHGVEGPGFSMIPLLMYSNSAAPRAGCSVGLWYLKNQRTIQEGLNMPVTSERSLCGNHSSVVLMAAGKLPDSPMPRQARAMPNCNTVLASAWPIAERLHKAMMTM